MVDYPAKNFYIILKEEYSIDVVHELNRNPILVAKLYSKQYINTKCLPSIACFSRTDKVRKVQ